MSTKKDILVEKFEAWVKYSDAYKDMMKRMFCGDAVGNEEFDERSRALEEAEHELHEIDKDIRSL